MVKIKTLIFLVLATFGMALAGAQQVDVRQQGYDFNVYVPAPIGSTGVPVCDAYFSQLEVCMKKLIPQDMYQELETGLTEAKQDVIYRAKNSREVEQYCQDAMNAARIAYTGQGCVFN